jgi:hypothetical protein
MTPRLLALAIVLAVPVLAGCNPAAKLHGTWDLETEAPPDGAASGVGTYIPSAIQSFMQLKRNIEFQEDGDCFVELKAGGQTEKSKGKWKWAKSEPGDVLVLKVALDGSEEKEVRVKFLDRNKIETLVLPAGEDESWTEETATFSRRGY